MLALVTGASSGIGLQYAHALARDYHTDLLLVSNQEKELIDVAETIANTYHVKTTPLYKDLTAENAAEELHQYCLDHLIKVDILINNAGVFFFNEYTKTNMQRIELMLKLHVMTLAKLCRLFGDDMRRHKQGYILNMSSMSAWMAMPGIQTYNATKAFILNFSKSLWYEFKPDNVHITVVCPGAVDTALYGLSDYWRRVAVAIGVSMPPEKLVKKALKALFKGKKKIMPGAVNHIFLPVIRHLPDWVIMMVIKRIAKFQK